MQRFLQFIVDEYLDERAHQLGEYGIGVSFYDRGPDFEPALDPIVRNDARRLRLKLLEYYRAGVRSAVLPFEVLSSRGHAGVCGRAISHRRPDQSRRCGDRRPGAAEFRLTHLVQGSVIAARDGLRLVVHLVHLGDGTQLWRRNRPLRAPWPARLARV